MEIGGVDTVIDGEGAPGEGAFIVAFLHAHWQELVVQDAEVAHTVGWLDPAIAAMHEFFVYRSPESFDSWEEQGATKDNCESMIHVLLGAKSTTLVADGDQVQVACALREAVIARRNAMV